MLAAILAGIKIASQVAALGIQVAPYLVKLYDYYSQPGGPTDAQLAELTAMEDEMDARLQAAQPGDQ